MEQKQDHTEVRRFRTSFAGRVYLGIAGILVLMAAIAAACSAFHLQPWLIFLLTLLIGLPIGAVLVTRILRPLDITLSGLRDGISSFRDRDFSVRLASGRRDEMGELARLYNDVGRLLQKERQHLRQKELLLETALDRSPVAIMLVNALGRIIFSNPEARKLLLGGARLEGRSFAELEQHCPEDMRDDPGRRRRRDLHDQARRDRRDLSTVRAPVLAQPTATPPCAAAPPHRRTRPSGSRDLEKSHPRHLPRTQQFVGADFVARSFGQTGRETARPQPQDRRDFLHHRRTYSAISCSSSMDMRSSRACPNPARATSTGGIC